ncbi:hypothetical protein Hdeb2414_s0018g00524881 [Helianthus debilis subsp. tardiflorus]
MESFCLNTRPFHSFVPPSFFSIPFHTSSAIHDFALHISFQPAKFFDDSSDSFAFGIICNYRLNLIVSSATDLPLGSSPIASSAFVDRSQIASSAIIGFFHNQVIVGRCSVDVQSQASSFKQTINQRTKSRT